MKKEDQQQFVNELIDNIKKDILNKVKEFPEEWDGIELRWYILERFSDIIVPTTNERIKKEQYNEFLQTHNFSTFNVWMISWCEDYISRTKKALAP